ncbi:OB-fold domain-containing protein [Acidimicrobiia bacterium EGI L10123]|uniref:Zn-ribbon domain-containing OB-fold protein n=1 Tax=Salinilacustrithrix flava TaxID=2957203 RepID=UPI003D7C27E5|nr:OB-fold domain-containing protein [Acidimicrobiia bacterium EGI L10123]
MSDTPVPIDTVEMPYVRTLGPVISRFFTGLRDGEIWANKTRTGKVQCPPFEYDPYTGESASDDWVQLDGTGTVSSWAWVEEPLRNHLLQEPFAWCLIRLDGADTDLVHAVRVADKGQMATGMRVEARWRDERIGHLRDIECFEPA